MLALLGILAFAPEAGAQLRSSTNTFALAFPAATQRAIGETEKNLEPGVSWDLVRRNGLVLTVQGRGEFDVAVFALAVDRGKVVSVWKSRSRMPAAAGSVSLSGKNFLPDETFAVAHPILVPAEQAGSPATVADAMRAIDSGSASAFLGRTAADATGVLLIAIPAMDGSSKAAASSTTNPRFARTETFSD